MKPGDLVVVMLRCAGGVEPRIAKVVSCAPLLVKTRAMSSPWGSVRWARKARPPLSVRRPATKREADTGMLEQVIMNLAVNSRDAMPKGGQLLITTSVLHVDAARARQHPDARPGHAVCLTVTDTGTGMD